MVVDRGKGTMGRFGSSSFFFGSTRRAVDGVTGAGSSLRTTVDGVKEGLALTSGSATIGRGGGSVVVREPVITDPMGVSVGMVVMQVLPPSTDSVDDERVGIMVFFVCEENEETPKLSETRNLLITQGEPWVSNVFVAL